MRKFCIWFITILLMFVASCNQTKEELLDEAYQLAKQKKYEVAIQVYTKVIKRNNRMQLAFYNRGIIYLKNKQYRQALFDFDRVMALQTNEDGSFKVSYNPDSPFATDEQKAQVPFEDALYQRAQARFYLDSLRGSLMDFQWLIKNEYREKSNCTLWQGSIYIRMRNLEQACISFHKSKELAVTEDEKLEADRMIRMYCDTSNNKH